jgi:hypothetical protein
MHCIAVYYELSTCIILYIYIYTVYIYGRGGDWLDRSDNSGYSCLSDTGAANLQKAGELNSSTTENLS